MMIEWFWELCVRPACNRCVQLCKPVNTEYTRAQQLLRWATVGHNKHGPKSEKLTAVPLSVGELGPGLTQCRPTPLSV